MARIVDVFASEDSKCTLQQTGLVVFPHVILNARWLLEGLCMAFSIFENVGVCNQLSDLNCSYIPPRSFGVISRF